MSTARDRILERVRRANLEREPVPHPGELTQGMEVSGERVAAVSGEREAAGRRMAADDLVGDFVRMLESAGGEAVLLEDEEAARRWLPDFAAEFRHATVAHAVEEAFRPALPDAAAEKADLGVSRAVAAVAQTGSLVLSSREGRRHQLLPPAHLVWVPATEVRATLADALADLRDDLPAALALHSGPSKSADIGQIVVTGVHGPGRLVAAVVGGRPAR